LFAAIAVGVAWVVFAGLPLAAEKAAARVPDNVSQFLGEQALGTFDKGFCRPSALPEDEQERIRNGTLRRVTSGLPDWGRYGLEFRDCRGVGANAFALPDATIVVTDRMVRLAQSDEELAAVLAHEVGHVQARHGLRMLLQAAGLAALLAA
jgi:Zn-dependent protease with chaperone function